MKVDKRTKKHESKFRVPSPEYCLPSSAQVEVKLRENNFSTGFLSKTTKFKIIKTIK